MLVVVDRAVAALKAETPVEKIKWIYLLQYKTIRSLNLITMVITEK